MVLKKIFLCISILLILAHSQTLHSKKTMYKLLSSSNVEEAIQELCPFPGYYGSYCPQDIPAAYKRQLQQGIPNMPAGVGASFDVSTGELKLPAIQLTYSQEPNQQQIYTDPISNNQFVIADETDAFQFDSGDDIRIFKNEFELANIWLDATKDGQWLGGQYSSSKDLIDVFERFFKGNQNTSIAQLLKNVVRISFKTEHNLKLNRFAQRAIDSLPEDYQEDIYNEFFNAWGTHIAVDTLIGGMIEKQTIFKDCVFFTPQFSGGASDGQVIQALRNELYGNEAEGFFTARRQVTLDHKFGGNPEESANWEQTISKNPALLKINRFLSWEYFTENPQVRENLSQAITRRIDLMRQRQESNQAQVREQRRLERVGPKTAWAIQGNGQCHLVGPSFQIRRQFQLQTSEVCLNSTDANWLQCTSGPQNTYDEQLNEVRYERDQEGRYRAIMHNPQIEFYPGGTRVLDGSFVDRGCSVAQNYRDAVYSSLDQTPPNETYIKMVCLDCHPDVYNTPSGIIFQCSCPTF
ncbi:MAC/perforin domain protein (macronuclear) [Tetrahymena thermophila SB210]|uniref:MAC/perforin domain protein n=1 Tax=Tetrahymena thermophila (strain SB210) TaxID=312017 RepID=Q23U44_TETTS|nr:MAC/perforin domain protein [Tetrahymena thermophila SB210]EAS00100.2 MAC/perforin domain protein [Tetrahymena thermophila SB210]|eukprot:XP_001020345.2 MAC/perforin domain protein [Tetrahymena thermophila SB210]